MGKLKLNLDEIKVESFKTEILISKEGGTVIAYITPTQKCTLETCTIGECCETQQITACGCI